MDLETWCQVPENQQGFWRVTQTGVAVSLGETPRRIFRQILQLLKCEYHDQNRGYGNLPEGVRIDENNQVVLVPNPNREPLASIRQDFLDFEDLVTRVETLISTVQPAYCSRKFHDLCRLLRYNYYKGVDGLRRFGFYMRNNPLFWDEAAKYLFFKKVLTIKEFGVRAFWTNVKLGDIQGWAGDVQKPHLVDVRDFDQNRNHPTYRHPDGSIVFYRNCLGHIREQKVADRYHDAKILLALEDDLPKVIPVWFYDLVFVLDLNKQKCLGMCGCSWMEFLSMQPSVFT